MRCFQRICLLMAVLPAVSLAQTTRPAIKDLQVLHLRATQAFAAGQYAAALPMLQKLEEAMRGDPVLAGPVREQIRVCERNLLAQVQSSTTAPDIKNRKPHEPPQPGEVRKLSIKQLGNFEYDPDKGGGIPADVSSLSGMVVRLRGYMIPIDQAENITEFALVPDLFACCFGQPPQIQHTVVVRTPKGKSVGYYPDEVFVEGKLLVQERKDEGFIVSLFELAASSVKPVSK